MEKTNVFEVGEYLIRRPFNERHFEQSALLCPLGLQKLLYYAQGWSLAVLDAELFDSPIEAWQHGPVVPEVYHSLKHKGCNLLFPQELCFCVNLNATARDVVEMVWQEYSQYSATKLMAMTRQEPAWLEARAGLPEDAKCTSPLSTRTMKRFFEAEAQKRSRAVGLEGVDYKEIWRLTANTRPLTSKQVFPHLGAK